jgi:hypothetical protein
MFSKAAWASADTCKPLLSILILDQTTLLSDDTKSIYDGGLDALIVDSPLEGLLVPFVRGQDGRFREGARECLRQIHQQANDSASENDPFYLRHTADFVLKQLSRKRSEAAKQEAKSANQAIIAEAKGQLDLVSRLKSKTASAMPVQDGADTLEAIISIAHDLCGHGEDCDFYIFSTLFDGRSKAILDESQITNPRKFGDDEARIVAGNFGLKKGPKAPLFVVWGFGRDEEDRPLDGNKRRRLMEYWTGAVSTLTAADDILITDRLEQDQVRRLLTQRHD